MRLFEIASAEEQIALFKLVSDSVWAALDTQQRQQAEQRAAQQAAAKSKPKSKGNLKAKLSAVKSLKPPQAKQLPSVMPTQFPQQPQSGFVFNKAANADTNDALTAAIKSNSQQQR